MLFTAGNELALELVEETSLIELENETEKQNKMKPKKRLKVFKEDEEKP